MKKLMINGFWLSLVFEILLTNVSNGANSQDQPVTSSRNLPATDITSARCIKTKEKKPVNTKPKSKQEQCLNTPKQCYNKQAPAPEKPSSIKLPVLFPVTREVAFQENIALPGGAYFAAINNPTPTF